MKVDSGGAGLKARLNDKGVLFGTFVSVRDLSLVEMLGSAGLGFCVIDQLHGALAAQSCADLVMAAQGAGLAPIVRVGQNVPRIIQRALDIGADGVQIAGIRSAADAESAARFSRYAPRGQRGLGLFTRADHYGKMSADEAVLHQNETTVVIAQLDPAVGESTLEGICDVDGIDVIFVSLGSLAVDAIDGKEGRPGLALRSRIGSIVSMAHAKGKVVGAHVENASAANDAVSEGVRLISVSYDRAIYMGGVRDLVERLN